MMMIVVRDWHTNPRSEAPLPAAVLAEVAAVPGHHFWDQLEVGTMMMMMGSANEGAIVEWGVGVHCGGQQDPHCSGSPDGSHAALGGRRSHSVDNVERSCLGDWGALGSEGGA